MTKKINRLVETTVNSQQVYQGSFLKLIKDEVRLVDGVSATREYLLHPGAAVIVALTDDSQVWLEYQYRHPVKQVVLEFPAGKLDPGETPLACAQRELQEETGILAKEWAYAGQMCMAVGYSDEVIHIFFARQLSYGKSKLDVGEQIELVKLTPQQLLQLCHQGQVVDSKTLVCCMWLQNVLSGQWQLNWQS